MKQLEQAQIGLRARLRRRMAGWGVGDRPSRLLVRLDDWDAPGPVPPLDRNMDAWQEQLVRFYAWGGVMPTVLISRPKTPLLLGLIRFCHRLEAPTILRTCGEGLSLRMSEELVDAGTNEVWLRMAAASDPLQEQLCGESLSVTREAVAGLLQARRERRQPLQVGMEVPFLLESARELPGVFRETRQWGVDRVRVVAPWKGPAWEERHSVMLDLLSLERPPFNMTHPSTAPTLRRMTDEGIGAPRLRGRCPVGQGQIEMGPDRSLRSCPFQEGATPAESFPEAWRRLSAHRKHISACQRECHHADLVP